MGRPILDCLVENEGLFEGKKVLVIGDIALDRTFRCAMSPPGAHATHGAERIYDILDEGDDYGAVGSSNNTLAICRSLQVHSTLVTAIGSDPEGDRVEQILRESGDDVLLLRLPDVRTVTRFRYFVLNPQTNHFELSYRFDKDPDIPLSYAKAEQSLLANDFLKRFEIEVTSSDVILFNDTDKGFLSPRVLATLGERIELAALARASRGLKRPIIVVDPKVEWEKYKGLHVDVIKPNHVEACKVLGLPLSDLSVVSNLKSLGDGLRSRYGDWIRHVVVTLGPLGAVALDCGDDRAELELHPAIPPRDSQSGVATHCGDMFASALGLSLSLSDDLSVAVDFANYVGSLQFSRKTGDKVSRADIVTPSNVDHFRAHLQEPRLISILKTLGTS